MDIERPSAGAEAARLIASREERVPWRKWGPYLSERQWGTVREDYSSTGDAWNYFPHDHARSRAYHWGEDGLAGFSDDRAAALLRAGAVERLFGTISASDILEGGARTVHGRIRSSKEHADETHSLA